MVMTRSASSSKRNRAEPTMDDRPNKKTKSSEPRLLETLGPGLEPGEQETSKYARDFDCRHKVGAHVSAAGGVENAILNAHAIGANAFALFLKSQRKWTSPPLKDTSVSCFKSRLKEYNYSPKHILPHGSYLINLGNPDKEKREKSYECFLDDLLRCEQLGLELYNFHPGSTVGITTPEDSISLIAECINRAHQATRNVRIVIENMAGAGNIIGADFSDLAAIIRQVRDKHRIGVCLDTCHMFAAGYDIRTKEDWDETISEFSEKVGLDYLCGMHLNDSKMPLKSKRDRHENIGRGQIGIQSFHHILNDPRVENIPLILETPTGERPEVWAIEIRLLNQLTGLSLENATLSKLVAASKDALSTTEVAKKTPGRRAKKTAREQADTPTEDGDE